MKTDHTAIYVKDLEREKNFFLRYFGGKAGELYRDPRTGDSCCFITFADASELELICRTQAPEEDAAHQPERSRVSINVGSWEYVDGVTAELEMDGFTVLSRPNSNGCGDYRSCILDREGHKIGITA